MRPALCSSYGGNEADGVLLETPAWALKASKTAVISLLLWMSGRHCSLIHVMDVFNVRKQAKQLCVGFFFVVVIAVRLRLAVRNGFDVALGAERSQTRLRVSCFTRKGFSLKRFFFLFSFSN